MQMEISDRIGNTKNINSENIQEIRNRIKRFDHPILTVKLDIIPRLGRYSPYLRFYPVNRSKCRVEHAAFFDLYLRHNVVWSYDPEIEELEKIYRKLQGELIDLLNS